MVYIGIGLLVVAVALCGIAVWIIRKGNYKIEQF